MAATVSSPWAKPGAWALDAEEHEAELEQQEVLQQQQQATIKEATADFPSLAAAAADLKQAKKKKKKTTAIPLALYQAGKYADPELTTAALPKGPRERSAEELDQIRGGGFRSYGMNSYRSGEDSSNSRWGRDTNSRSSGPRDRDSSREREPLGPSRADEDDDWSKAKKSPAVMNGNGFDRRDRDRDRGSSFFDSQSKADEASSWVSNKPAVEPRKFGGGGFERRGSFDSISRDRQGSVNGGGSADSETWGRRREEGDGSGAVTARPKLVLQPRTVPVSNDNESAAKPKGSSPFGDAKPRDEVLQPPRAAPVSDENELVVKPRSSNPFGSARPREEVLAEKGQDWKEIDEKLESMKLNIKNEEDKVEKLDKTSRWSFGRVGSGETVERSWRKPDSVDFGSRPQSAETVENGVENGHSDSTEHENGKQDENGTAAEEN
ncbi:unnamed protein product [Linum trigynum]|uniref:Eukaryotic translation initiation factor 4B3-like n=1 Tax=Linum trigynum TaxID=586398 RepID=A0AAV2EGQ2_9ROSI